MVDPSSTNQASPAAKGSGDEAVPAGAARPYQVMAKTTGPICNLDCSYCYYLEKEDLYPGTPSFHMSDEVLEAFVRQYVWQPRPVVDFAWQGGEPTLVGLDFFRKVVALQDEHRPPGRRIRNVIQTNGTLLDDDWCAFLREHGFLVGLSIDGPRRLHDRYRVDKGGKGSFDRVVRGLECLKRHGVEHNLLCSVSRANMDHPLEVYSFFRELGTAYWQFIPVVEPQGNEVSEASVTPEGYGAFMTTVFDHWVRNDVGRVSIRLFDTALRVHAGLSPGLCIFEETCGDALAVEHNGDLYSCDHFVDPEHLLGNIRETEMAELVASQRQRSFGTKKRDTLPGYCRRCDVRSLCNGGCPKNRFTRTPDGEPGLNYLCAGYKRIFGHTTPYLEWMATEHRAGRPPTAVMDRLREDPAAFAPEGLGRNDPCYCGSGRKFKRCCGGPG